MTIRMAGVLVVATAWTAGAAAAAAAQQQRRPDRDCPFEATREFAVAAQAADRLRLTAAAGELEVRGEAGVREVRVTGRACASTRELLSRVQIEGGRSGSTVRVEAQPQDDDGRNWDREWWSLDLVVTVPAGMAAEIVDGSGSMALAGLGALTVTDGSGEVRIEGARGRVRVEDGSGEVEVTEVDGDVRVDDGSGDVRIAGVTGSVTVNDGSGSIEISDVGGDVDVPADGSGNVTVREVAGDLHVSEKGTGSVSHSGVRGTVDIPVDDNRHRSRRRTRRGGE